MNTVMLIEDEPPILQMVKEMIEASSQGFVVTQTAYNGRKALQLLEESERKPDLIATDIRMPVMDGLQLMRELEARGYDIPCIILSGYSDFNYAREALKFGAFDYLLKPLKEDHLEQSLGKAARLLLKRKEAGERAYLKQALRLPDDSDVRPADPGYAGYQLLLVRKGNCRNDEWEALAPAWSVWRQRETAVLEASLRAAGDPAPLWWMSGAASNEKIAVRALRGLLSPPLGREAAEALMADWRRSGEGGADKPASLAVSEPVAPDRMAAALRALREALAHESRIGESKIWCQGDPRAPDFVLTAEMEQSCRTIAKSPDYRAFEKAMLGWTEKWRREGYGQSAIESLLSAIVRLFRALQPAEGAGCAAAFDANELVFGCESLDEVAEQFGQFMEREYERLRGARPDRSAKDLIDNVRRYMDEHYMEPLGSETLQHVFGYHKTYIANMFSEVVGMPPGKYLTRLRIDKAIALLNERSGLSLRQIAEQVGYEDSLYFSKVFKSVTGRSPKEYKERRN